MSKIRMSSLAIGNGCGGHRFIYIYILYIYIHVYPRHCIIQANNLDHIYDSSVRFER